VRVFGWVVLIQTVLIGAAVWWCVRASARDLIWPAIGLIVSAHFAPLAHLFHVRAYYATAFAGIVISLSALAGFTDNHRLVWFGPGMAAVMWLSGWHIIRNANLIVARASRQEWKV
jgi:hypothetical protein